MNRFFSRRLFLRGLGVSMALPWMESTSVWGEPLPSQDEAPKRLAILFSGNGYHKDHWWAKANGRELELGSVLKPLDGFRDKLVFVRGLYNEEALKGNIHSSQTGNLLSGAPLASGGEIRSGTSVDQVVAQVYGQSTKLPSLVLGARSRTHRCTRIIRCCTVRTSRGVRRQRPHRLRYIPL